MNGILQFLKIFLYPISIIFGCIIWLRNWLYDSGIWESVKPKVYTINVGNLAVGGTGKTPHIEYLISLLSGTYNTTILSRGYGRKTKGFVEGNENSSAQSIGDEPFQIYEKYNKKIKVVVCEKRLVGIEKIQKENPNNEIILLDDAYQHRAVSASLNILLLDYNRPFYSDFMLPMGRLRDNRKSAKRADIVIITKCKSEISEQEKITIETKIAHYTKKQTPIFYSKISYGAIINYDSVIQPNSNKFILVEGIANIEPMVRYLAQQKMIIEETYHFNDHFDFDRPTIEKIINKHPNSQILTTEKDYVKIKPLLTENEKKQFCYLPISVEIEPKKVFDDLILRSFKAFQNAKSEEI